LYGTVYVFQQQLLHSPNELPAENCRYINGDIYVEPRLLQNTDIKLNQAAARTTYAGTVLVQQFDYFQALLFYCILFVPVCRTESELAIFLTTSIQ